MRNEYKRYTTVFTLLFSVTGILAQHQELNEKPGLWKEKQNKNVDSNSLASVFRKGKLHGHFRYYFMHTDNASGLTDYYANAIGGGIKFETAPYKGFQLGISGFFAYNIGSSNLAVPDEKSGQMNRYEIGLFDITDPHNKKDIDRLEELYLKYSLKNTSFTLGKQLINTPFINLQDGRMRPTEVGGLWFERNGNRKLKWEGGFIYEISPRSTVKWYRVGASIGVYPAGVNVDGTKSGYAGNIQTKGILLAGLSYKIGPRLEIKGWNQFVENVFNTAMIQLDYHLPAKENSKWISSAQFIRQDAVHEGGNADPAKTYFKKGAKSQSFGIKAGWEGQRWNASLNYNRITREGRYLMPREWGRDPFFTFLPRERNDGLGDVHAYLAKFGYSFPSMRLKTQAGLGYYQLPDVNNFALNKYGMPSYWQLNIDLRYQFNGFLHGLETQLLYVYKGKKANTYGNEKFVINKVDMSLWNFVVNYNF